MPTVLRSGPYRVYFYSHESNEPAHVHIDRDQASCKFWLWPVGLAGNLGSRAPELRDMANPGERIMRASCNEDSVVVELADGRTLSAPLAWYPRLLHATPQQRSTCVIAGGGYGIHWPEIDEDLSVDGLLRGAPAPRVSAKAS